LYLGTTDLSSLTEVILLLHQMTDTGSDASNTKQWCYFTLTCVRAHTHCILLVFTWYTLFLGIKSLHNLNT